MAITNFNWKISLRARLNGDSGYSPLPQSRIDLYVADAESNIIYPEKFASFRQFTPPSDEPYAHIRFTVDELFKAYPELNKNLEKAKIFFKIYSFDREVAVTINPLNVSNTGSILDMGGYLVDLEGKEILGDPAPVELRSVVYVYILTFKDSVSSLPIPGVIVQALGDGKETPFVFGTSGDDGKVVLTNVDRGLSAYGTTQSEHSIRAIYGGETFSIQKELFFTDSGYGFLYLKDHNISADINIDSTKVYSTLLTVYSQVDSKPIENLTVYAIHDIDGPPQILDTKITNALGQVRIVLSHESLIQTLGFVPENIKFLFSVLDPVEPIITRAFLQTEQNPENLAWIPSLQEQGFQTWLDYTRPVTYQDIFETDASAGYIVIAHREFYVSESISEFRQISTHVLDLDGRFVFDHVSSLLAPRILFTLHATADGVDLSSVYFDEDLTPLSEVGEVITPQILTFSYSPTSTNFDNEVLDALGKSPYKVVGSKPEYAFSIQTNWRSDVVKASYASMKTNNAWMKMQAGHGNSDMLFDQPSCACDGCVSAVSPIAYFIDLMKFCEQKVTVGVNALDVDLLTHHFKQNFSGLSTNCALSKTTYSMATLGAEVLRRALSDVSTRQTFARRQDVHAFRRAVYERLLVALRIDVTTYRSYERIPATLAARTALAHAAGLMVTDFEQLLLDPQLDPVPAGSSEGDVRESRAISEQKLEWLFGWVATEHELLLVPGALPLDPLRTPSVPQLLVWRRNYLETTWKLQDHAANEDPFALPIIEPDLVSITDLVPRVGDVENPALVLLEDRRAQVEVWVSALNAERGEGLDEVLKHLTTAELNIAHVKEKFAEFELGQDIAAWLVERRLTLEEFRVIAKLVMQHEDLEAPVELDEEEWQELIAILVQAKKRFEYEAWRLQENEEPEGEEALPKLHFGPLYFAPVADAFDTQRLQTPTWFAWRHNPRQRQARQELIRQRTVRYNALEAEFKEAVQRTEGQTLETLRTMLLKHHTSNSSIDVLEIARELGQRYFVDFAAAPTLRKDRVSFAIDTLQDLLFSARTGQLTWSGLTLDMDNWDFEQAWQWLGKYETWVSGMMVTLYPENFLDPSWHRESTSIFKQAVNELSVQGDLTRAVADDIAENYYNKYLDISDLSYLTVCKGSFNERDAYYFFASNSLKIWMSIVYEVGDDFEQKHWERVPGLDTGSFVGAAMIGSSIRLFILNKNDLEIYEYFMSKNEWRASPQKISLATDIGFTDLRLVTSKYVGDNVWMYTDYNRTIKGFYLIKVNTSSGKLVDVLKIDGTLVYALEISGFCYIFLRKNNKIYIKRVDSLLTLLEGEVTFQIDENAEYNFIPRTDNVLSILKLKDKKIINQIDFRIGEGGSAFSIYNYSEFDFNFDGYINRILVGYFVDPAHAIVGIAQYITPNRSTPAILKINTTSSKFIYLSSKKIAPNSVIYMGRITRFITNENEQRRRALLANLFEQEGAATPQTPHYMREVYFFLPMLFSNRLRRAGDYLAALDWLSTVYNYSKPFGERWVYPGLMETEPSRTYFSREDAWMMDPTDPHALAAQNPQAYARYILIELLGCLLDYADEQFQLDTKESIVKARRLYSTVLQILEEESDLLPRVLTGCDLSDAAVLRTLPESLGDDLHPLDGAVVPALLEQLDQINSPTERGTRLAAISAAIAAAPAVATKRARAALLAAADLPIPPAPQTLPAVMAAQLTKLRALIDQRGIRVTDIKKVEMFGSKMAAQFNESVKTLLGKNPLDGVSGNTSWLASGTTLVPSTGRYNFSDPRLRADNYRPQTSQVQTLLDPAYKRLVTAFSFQPIFAFCVPLNPTYKTAVLRAQLNLFKLSQGYNFAGLPRAQLNYEDVAVTRTLPMLSATVTLPAPDTEVLRATPYRASYLLARAQNLVSLAQQIEAQFLSAIEKREQENYALLLAEQSVAMSRKSLAVQDSRLREVEFQQNFASINIAKAQSQLNYYNDLISEGILEKEKVAIGMMITAGVAQSVGSFFTIQNVFTGGASGALAATAAAASTTANVLQTFAAYERRDQEWRQQRQLSKYDVKLAQLQQQQGQLQLRTANQERAMVELQTTHASQVLTFLTQKFTNAELYDWMSGVLGGIYRNLLGQASHIARLAADQLAFERQDASLKALIVTDYGQRGVEQTRLGLTGSARLLQDLQTLEQQALLSQRRLLQMTRTFSLSRSNPNALLSLRQDGGATFAIPAELLDAEFPGHTHRTIHHVTVSLIAITPAIEGIRASLTCSAARRVGDPARIDFTAPYGATGLFALDAQSELLRPFEGIALVGEEGVGSSNWSLEIPRITNPLLDYETIADVLLTIEYTARYDAGKEQRVREELLKRPIEEERRFSLRNEFADAWYTLIQQAEAMDEAEEDGDLEASFVVRPRDFAPGRQAISTFRVSLLLIPAQDQDRISGPVAEIVYALDAETSAAAEGDGQFLEGWINSSTSSALAALGTTSYANKGYWTLRFPAPTSGLHTIKAALLAGQIADIVLSISYTAVQPGWPNNPLPPVLLTPQLLLAPTITGAFRVGEQLVASSGAWRNASSYSHQWQRNGVDILGATTSTYTLVTADMSASIRCLVGAAGPGGTASPVVTSAMESRWKGILDILEDDGFFYVMSSIETGTSPGETCSSFTDVTGVKTWTQPTPGNRPVQRSEYLYFANDAFMIDDSLASYWSNPATNRSMMLVCEFEESSSVSVWLAASNSTNQTHFSYLSDGRVIGSAGTRFASGITIQPYKPVGVFEDGDGASQLLDRTLSTSSVIGSMTNANRLTLMARRRTSTEAYATNGIRCLLICKRMLNDTERNAIRAILDAQGITTPTPAP